MKTKVLILGNMIKDSRTYCKSLPPEENESTKSNCSFLMNCINKSFFLSNSGLRIFSAKSSETEGSQKDELK